MTTTEQQPTTVQVGDFFYTSWGYDQTNVDFYEVVGMSASGKTIKVQEVRQDLVDGTLNGSSVRTVPVAGSTFGDNGVQTKKLRTHYRDGTACRPAFFVASYADAHLWDGSPKHQTGIGWGH